MPIDAHRRGEVDGVDKKVYWEVVDHCYLCDMCFMTKCPYVPPHPWNVDFPHLMLRAKAAQPASDEASSFRDKRCRSDRYGRQARRHSGGRARSSTRSTRSSAGRALLEKTLGVDADAPMPKYHSRTARKRLRRLGTTRTPRGRAAQSRPTEQTTGKVALFTTCYGNRNEPELDEDLVAVFEHNGIPVTLVAQEHCCGMPQARARRSRGGRAAEGTQHPAARSRPIDAGYDIVAPIPSCVLMFKQELPLMFPDDADVQARARRASSIRSNT